ncbi:MAG: SpoIIE family protein phosphatase [Chloroflexaceae bacterium]|nr:SpoIIE family protein phosphatase [Chloroflexaceae bacterium]
MTTIPPGGTVIAESPVVRRQGGKVPLSGHPVVAQMAETGRPVLAQVHPDDPHASLTRVDLQGLGIVTVLALPMINREQMIGAIELGSTNPAAFGADERSLYLTVATTVGASLENARLLAAEQEARRTADTLREVARVLNASLDPQEVLQLILRELQNVVRYDSASVMLIDHDMLRVAAWRTNQSDVRFTSRQVYTLQDKKGIAQVLQRQQPLLIDDTSISPYWSHTPDSNPTTRSWLGIPLLAESRSLGILNINARQPHAFDERDLEVALAFANQASVALERARLYEESVRRIEREMQIAREIQSNLFPKQLPTMDNLQLWAESFPAKETGGDFYDVIALPDQRLAVMIGDASGKSIPGALLMAVARSTARSEALNYDTPQDVLSQTNRLITADVPHHSFVALSYAILDVPAQQLCFANAGQLMPLRYTAAGALEYLYAPPGLPLGIDENYRYAPLDVALHPGDLLLFFTDGVVEAHDRNRELFGFERLEGLMIEYGKLPPRQLVYQIVKAVQGFCGDMPQHDDITLVALRVG